MLLTLIRKNNLAFLLSLSFREKARCKLQSPSPHSSPLEGKEIQEVPSYSRIGKLTILLALLASNNATADNVKIGIPSLTVTMMPVAVARDRGFFQNEGLNVEMVLMPASLNVKVLLSGDIQYATTITSGIVANVRGVNTRVVMCFVDRPLLDLVGNPEIGASQTLKGNWSESRRAADSTMSRCDASSLNRAWTLRRRPSSRSENRARYWLA